MPYGHGREEMPELGEMEIAVLPILRLFAHSGAASLISQLR